MKSVSNPLFALKARFRRFIGAKKGFYRLSLSFFYIFRDSTVLQIGGDYFKYTRFVSSIFKNFTVRLTNNFLLLYGNITQNRTIFANILLEPHFCEHWCYVSLEMRRGILEERGVSFNLCVSDFLLSFESNVGRKGFVST